MKKFIPFLFFVFILNSNYTLGQWVSVGDGLDSMVYSLTPTDNYLIATGVFTHSGTNNVNKIGFFDGYQWTGPSSAQPVGNFYTSCLFNDTLYAVSSGGLYYWDDTDWHLVLTFQTPCSPSLIRTFKDFLYIFTDFYIYRVENDTLVTIGQTDNPISTACIYNDTLFCGGCFSGVNTVYSPHLIKFDGTQWYAVNPLINQSSAVYSIAVFNNILYIGGAISGPGNFLLEYNGTSLTQSSLLPNDLVEKLLVCNGKLFIAGYFTQIGEVSVQKIAVWDGTTMKNAGNGLFLNIYAMASWNGEAYMGGYFNFGGNTKYIAKYDEASSVFIPVSGGSDEPSVFPNPVNSASVIMLPHGSVSWDIQVFDNTGKCIATEYNNTTEHFSLSSIKLTKGIYLFRLSSAERKIKTGKFTVN